MAEPALQCYLIDLTSCGFDDVGDLIWPDEDLG